MAYGPIPGSTPDLGAVATVDHPCGRAGTPGEHPPVAGRWVLPIRRGAGSWCATGRRPHVGQAVSRPASGGPYGRPWPRGPGRLPPRRWRSPSCGWPASARIRGAAAGPRGMARNWRTSSSRRGAWRPASAATVRRMLACHHLKPWRPHRWLSPQRPRDAALSATISARIDLDPRPVPEDALVLSVRRTPPCRLVRVSLLRGPRHQGTFRAAMHMKTSAAGLCMYVRHAIPVRAPSLGTVPPVSVSRNASPFWNSGRRPWVTLSRRFISGAIRSAHLTVTK
jgi:hypothetical protein